MRWFAALCLLLLQTGSHGFELDVEAASQSHQEITESAILRVTLEVCAAVAKAGGEDFKAPVGPLTATSVAVACEAEKSAKTFSDAIEVIKDENVDVDYYYFWSSKHHFDAEEFKGGKKIITDALKTVKFNNKRQKYETAREGLGKLLHTLQDFYSHSNWVEMGNRNPNANLINAGADIGKIADKKRRTCINCNGDDCRNNILQDILDEKILTSGYFALVSPFSKPAGKCSHGGGWDMTRFREPRGGINKDSVESEHGHLHNDAAKMATAATADLLQNIRAVAGDINFLRMMGIKKGKPLCFVIDTTGSMSDDISAVRFLTSAIIDKKRGTDEEPSDYILVPFNDPSFGPLTSTTDADKFKAAINSLSATGGGDFPEMSLSGLQLALTGSPPGSEIYLFTDATAKDGHLIGAVLALIERTKSVVTFLLTGSLGSRRRRETDDNEQQQHPFHRLTRTSTSLYTKLAEASGGQTIQVSKSQLAEATSIITETSSLSLVKLLQASRNSGSAENFTFSVDASVKNLTMYITGSSVTFTVISPSGVTQSSTNMTGPLIISSSTVGNFQTVKLDTQVGQWEVQMVSPSAYNLKVVGESPIDFLFSFLKDTESPYGGLQALSSRPRSGENSTLRVTLTGTDSATVTEVTLVELISSVRVNGSVKARGRGIFYVEFDRIPSEDFVVLVMGQTSTSTRAAGTVFQRQSSTSVKASAVTVTATFIDTVAEPGVPFSVPFSVATSGAGGTFTISATNDQGYSLSFPSSLSLPSGGSSNSTANLIAPVDTPSGTDVTLTIEATSPGGTDSNYAVLRITVLAPVTDITAPLCQLPNVTGNCSDNCTESMWEVSLQVTDGVNGTGIDTITFRDGDGALSTTLLPDNATLVIYNASCCSPDVSIIVVDDVGNVNSCSFSVRKENPTIVTPFNNTTTTNTNTTTTTVTTPPKTTSAAVPLSTSAAQLFVLFLSATILGLC